ncbi:MAG: orotate phosphoribosyltransferase [Gemmatimonadaceae bacterium]
MTDNSALVALLAERSAKRGRFTLASGRQSDFYIDARLTTMSPEGLVTIGVLGLRTLQNSGWRVTAVGGLTLGADPISYAISYASALTDNPLRAFTVRKEPKAHGTGRLLEGPFRDGDRVAIIEDVITTGASTLRAIDAVQSLQGLVMGVLALVDREEGGRDSILKLGIPVISLVRMSEIIEALTH